MPGAKPFTLVKGLQHNWALVGSKGGTLYLITNKDAPPQRIVAFDATRPATAPREVVRAGRIPPSTGHRWSATC